MGFLDRMLERDTVSRSTDTQLTSQEPDEDNLPILAPTVTHQRIAAMMGHFVGSLSKLTSEGSKGPGMARVLGRLSREALRDMEDAPPEVVEYYFRQAACMMHWAATGEPIPGIPFPEGFSPEVELYSPEWQELIMRRPDPEEIDEAQRAAITQ